MAPSGSSSTGGQHPLPLSGGLLFRTPPLRPERRTHETHQVRHARSAHRNLRTQRPGQRGSSRIQLVRLALSGLQGQSGSTQDVALRGPPRKIHSQPRIRKVSRRNPSPLLPNTESGSSSQEGPPV